MRQCASATLSKADAVDRGAQVAGPFDERQQMDIGLRINAVPAGAAVGGAPPRNSG